MAVIPLDTDALRERALLARIDRHLAALGLGFNPYLERLARIDALRRLDRMSETELRAAGLTREGLVAHVFGPDLGPHLGPHPGPGPAREGASHRACTALGSGRNRSEGEGMARLAQATGMGTGGGEPLYRVTGDLPRIAWHLGLRRVPCEFREGALLVPADPALKAALERLGAGVEEASGPFAPEPPDAAGHVSHHSFRHHLSEEEAEPDEGGAGPEPAR